MAQKAAILMLFRPFFRVFKTIQKNLFALSNVVVRLKAVFTNLVLSAGFGRYPAGDPSAGRRTHARARANRRAPLPSRSAFPFSRAWKRRLFSWDSADTPQGTPRPGVARMRVLARTDARLCPLAPLFLSLARWFADTTTKKTRSQHIDFSFFW